MSRPAPAADQPTAAPWAATALRVLPWREPLAVLAAFADEPFAIALLSDGRGWSYVARHPVATFVGRTGEGPDPLDALTEMLGPSAPAAEDGPPFQGGAAGLLGYGLGARLEPSVGTPDDAWPEAAFGLYAAMLAFDHDARRVVAVGRGAHMDEAWRRAEAAAGWSEASAHAAFAGALGVALRGEAAAGYEAAVAGVVERIRAGELFQANIARRWSGRLAAGARPFDLLQRLAQESPAPFAAYLRLEDRALVSNSPERFVSVGAGGQVEARPVKGTRPRGAGAAEDARLRRELAASEKDRAENLMIVDLMRNDLARVCVPGSVETPALFAVESFANVHHLVSTVTGALAPDRTVADLLRASFPAGSVTGAPKVQAMRVIARCEAARGPYCGAMFRAGFDGRFDSSVLIRTAACIANADGWGVEARAGAGIVADSDPAAEARETEAKIAAILRALEGPAA